MSCFNGVFPKVAFSATEDGSPKLRRAQLGALFAVVSHFTLSDNPAIVTMPTGSGKSAVLMLLPYMLQSKRVLVLTSSRLVRGQIADEFKTLRTLQHLGVIPADVIRPTVFEVKTRVQSHDQWDKFGQYDVVVTIPQALNTYLSGQANGSKQIENMFDVILVDEAHHSPAKTWTQVMNKFPLSRKCLFTATPFRRDKHEIPGSLVYNYSMSEAYQDRIFSEIEFVPVSPSDGDRTDIAIAQKVEEIFCRDKQDELNHKVLVRTDSVKKAKELVGLYEKNTVLRLKLIHSQLSYKYVESIINMLKRNDLDGVICVNMLSEGFDLPTLKIAAIHTPHKSLAITLQFIGRFARTSPNVGRATFVAAPTDITFESEQLFEEGVTWAKIVPDLAEAVVSRAIELKESLQTFSVKYNSDPNTEDLSLYSLRPVEHVKIFDTDGVDVDLDSHINLAPLESVHRQYSKKLSTTVLIVKETKRPRWSEGDQFTQILHDLIIIHYHRDCRLLFICSSRRSEDLYSRIATQVTQKPVKSLSLHKLSRVLLDLKHPKFFNVGMRNRSYVNAAESYRVITGQIAQKSITRSDGRFYQRGHVFGSAMEDSNMVTIGISSSSKVWSSTRAFIPGLVSWCGKLAEKIRRESVPITNSEIDHLATGVEIDSIPEGVISADWPIEVYLSPIKMKCTSLGKEFLMSETSLTIDHLNSNETTIHVLISTPFRTWSCDFSVRNLQYFTTSDKELEACVVLEKDEEVPFIQFINQHPLGFYFSDMSTVVGNEWFKAPEDLSPYNVELIEPVDWRAEGVDPTVEFGSKKGSVKSVQDYISSYLDGKSIDVVVFDHGSGEIADFFTVTHNTDKNTVDLKFFHCKGSSGESAGNRVDDVYEVCGQAVKSLVWVHRNNLLMDKVNHRLKHHPPTKFIHGDVTKLEQLITLSQTTGSTYQMIVVQPGVSKNKIQEKISHVLQTANEYLIKNQCEPLVVIGSK